jgi:hypothetical protein
MADTFLSASICENLRIVVQIFAKQDFCLIGFNLDLIAGDKTGESF